VLNDWKVGLIVFSYPQCKVLDIGAQFQHGCSIALSTARINQEMLDEDANIASFGVAIGKILTFCKMHYFPDFPYNQDSIERRPDPDESS